MDPNLRRRSVEPKAQAQDATHSSAAAHPGVHPPVHRRKRYLGGLVILFLGSLWALTPHSLRDYDFEQRHSAGDLFDDLPRAYAVCSAGAPVRSTHSFVPGLMNILEWLAFPTSHTLGRLSNSRGLLKLDHPRIYTADPALEETNGAGGPVECLVVKDGVVLDATSRVGVAKWCEERSRKEKVSCDVRVLQPGQALIPGLHDAHGHVLDYGWARTVVDLVGATSVADVVARLESYIREKPDLLNNKEIWIEGLGWDQTKWDPAVFPSAADFSHSEILAGRRIALRRIDVHALWLSQEALDAIVAAGKMPPPGQVIEGGLVVRDNSGRPTGVLVDKAMDIAYAVIPSWTETDRLRYLSAALEGLLAVGITSVGDAAVDPESLAFYKRAADNGSLPLRIYAMVACPTKRPRCATEVERMINYRSRLTVRTVKLFADGALGSWGSSMWEPYSDKPTESGLMLLAPEEIKSLVRYWVEHNFQVASHAIGDHANTLVLDAYEEILKEGGLAGDDLRLRIEHAQIIRAGDIDRFGQLGVIASMQPTHCTSDMHYVDTRIGAERSKGAYAWRSLLTNASLALGSDFPVELPNPLHGFYAAISRLDEHGNSPHGRNGWHPQQRLSRAQALRGFTLAAAHAQFEEHIEGSLLPGKRADFVVLDRDIMDERVPLADVRSARVLATIINGKTAFSAES